MRIASRLYRLAAIEGVVMSDNKESVIKALYTYVAKLDENGLAGKAVNDFGRLQISELVLDSLDMLELGMMISDRFGTEIDILELPPEATFDDVCDQILLQFQ